METAQKIQILQDLVKIPSVNGDEEAVALYLQKLFADYQIPAELVEYAPGRSSIVAQIGNGSGKVLGFTGHEDVVAAGDEQAWKYPPFSGTIEGNKLYGRGSTDMKSGLAAMAIAMIELQEAGVQLSGTLKFLGTVGEEVGELGAQQLTAAGYADDLDGLIIGEPSNYMLVYTHMGSINYTVRSDGKEAHSSLPQEGFNAIDHLNKFITKANEQMAAVTAAYEDPELGRTIHNVTMISGGVQVNSIPGSARLQGNIRSIPAYGNEKIIADLQGIVDELNEGVDYHLHLQIDYDKIPVASEKDSELIQVIQQQFDKPLPTGGISATTDAAELTKSSKSFDVVIFGPGVPTLPHQVDEYVEIDNYLDMIEKYQEIAKSYL